MGFFHNLFDTIMGTQYVENFKQLIDECPAPDYPLNFRTESWPSRYLIYGENGTDIRYEYDKANRQIHVAFFEDANCEPLTPARLSDVLQEISDYYGYEVHIAIMFNWLGLFEEMPDDVWTSSYYFWKAEFDPNSTNTLVLSNVMTKAEMDERDRRIESAAGGI